MSATPAPTPGPTAPAHALLSVSNLRLAFGGVAAVDDLSFDVAAGDITSVIGPNGAGKTSAFNCITGFYKPTSGAVVFDGDTITCRRPSDIAARGVARTFQNLRLFGELTVLDNVRAGMHLRLRQGVLDALLHTPRFKRSEAEATEQAHKWLDFVGVRSNRGAQARNLSYGEQRRVEIARALAREPKLLLLDEPAAGLNHSEKGELLDLLHRISGLGTAVVLIEHDMGLVMQVSRRIVVLNFGREIADGTPEQVRANPAVVEAYLGADSADSADSTNSSSSSSAGSTGSTGSTDSARDGESADKPDGEATPSSDTSARIRKPRR